MVAPKMMLASACTASDTIAAASLISNRPRSEPPAIESSTPWAPSIDSSSSGLETASSAASTARFSPRAEPMPIRAEPALDITDFTSAKSRLIRPGVVIRSVMPETPCSSTWSACLKASSMLTLRSEIISSLSLGITMRVSTSSRRLAMPSSAEVGATTALEGERAGHHTDGQRTERAGDLGDDRGATGAGATALAGGHEDHVGALEHLFDLLGVVLGGLRTHVGVRAGTETTGQLTADVELDIGVTHQQGLRIGVDRDELDALQPDLDHPVDGVDSTSTNTHDLDHGQVVLGCCHGGASHVACHPALLPDELSDVPGEVLRPTREP